VFALPFSKRVTSLLRARKATLPFLALACGKLTFAGKIFLQIQSERELLSDFVRTPPPLFLFFNGKLLFYQPHCNGDLCTSNYLRGRFFPSRINLRPPPPEALKIKTPPITCPLPFSFFLCTLPAFVFFNLNCLLDPASHSQCFLYIFPS